MRQGFPASYGTKDTAHDEQNRVGCQPTSAELADGSAPNRQRQSAMEGLSPLDTGPRKGKGKLESQVPGTDRPVADRPGEPVPATEPITGSFEVATYDYIIFEQVDGNWQLQPQGLQVEIGHQSQDSSVTAANSYQAMQQKEEPKEGNEETVTAEDIRWIHGTLATPTIDLRRERGIGGCSP